ncbi:MAG: hypothetical protein QOI57_2252 [Rubrobacteraceae bacterium]|jgi:hypothetical protein|nr:hypothetical protein [Rubrobacteraceae bacterium]
MDPQPPTPNLTTIKVLRQRAWASGDYAMFGATLLSELVDLVNRFNRSGDERMVVPSDYLEVVALRC